MGKTTNCKDTETMAFRYPYRMEHIPHSSTAESAFCAQLRRHNLTCGTSCSLFHCRCLFCFIYRLLLSGRRWGTVVHKRPACCCRVSLVPDCSSALRIRAMPVRAALQSAWPEKISLLASVFRASSEIRQRTLESEPNEAQPAGRRGGPGV